MLTPCEAETVFIDSFENGLVDWQVISLSGDRPWDVNGDGDINGGPCARFWNNYDPPYNAEDDWLILGPVSTYGQARVELSFMGNHLGNGALPILYYTDAFNGNVADSNWVELPADWGDPYSWNPVEPEAILDPPEELYVAFHYTASTTAGENVQVDDFSVKTYATAELLVVGESDYFRFLTDMEGQEHYWEGMADLLDERIVQYASLWNRPGDIERIPETTKVDVIFTQKGDIPFFSEYTPSWRCAAASWTEDVIYLSPLQNPESESYYGSLENMSLMALGQFAIARHFNRTGDTKLSYFIEAFGRYESGIRPDVDKVRAALSELGTDSPDLSVIETLAVYNDENLLNLLLSYIEFKVLHNSYFGIYPYGQQERWAWFLQHHYLAEGGERRRLIHSTDNFDFYGADTEIPNVENFGMFFEDLLLFDESRYGLPIDHRFIISIYPDDLMLELMDGRDWISGRSTGGCMIEVLHLPEGSEFGLMVHEFMHCVVHLMNIKGPGQLLNEGIATFADHGPVPDDELPNHYYKFHEYFYHFQKKYGRDPTIDEFIDNTEGHVENGHWLDVYFFGHLFWTYILEKYQSYEVMTEFIVSDRDWSVFSGRTKEEEGAEFIQFLKEVSFMGPPLEASDLPFMETFESGNAVSGLEGWTIIQKEANDLWQCGPYGIDGSDIVYIQHPYFLEDKNVDTWLVSPPLDVSQTQEVVINFDYISYGSGPGLELYYTDSFYSSTIPAEWTQVPDAGLVAGQGVWIASRDFRIPTPWDKVYLAIRYTSSLGDVADFHIDNVRVWSDIQPPPQVNAGDCWLERSPQGNLSMVVADTDSRFVYRLETSSDMIQWTRIGNAETGTDGKLVFNIGPLEDCTCDYFRVCAGVAQ